MKGWILFCHYLTAYAKSIAKALRGSVNIIDNTVTANMIFPQVNSNDNGIPPMAV